MAATGFRFEGFHLDPGNRRLTRNGAPVELNARYLDALLLLVREPGQLVPKDRFMGEVWRGIPVTELGVQGTGALGQRLIGGGNAARHVAHQPYPRPEPARLAHQ
ncbi:winged helix-turn-helix domain-containing protein [Sphingomonas koreensis]|uniref:winged helix-turn-helix domain-containing protein n=1 Tax=Sphingomonas koreensis TaxID=93064 RepID=UPI000F7E6381|nr:hypothetical protein [Sphingomonas koreensis]RSV34374.1 hypothetical protein CA232_17440 [Sphingomonas koreensis]